MATITTQIEVNYIWIKENTQCQKCSSCGDLIFSDAFRLNVFIKNPKAVKKFGYNPETDVCICESCNDVINGGSNEG